LQVVVRRLPVTSIVIAMIVIVAIAAAVVVYVAFPHRGERLPVVPVLGDAMRKSVDALPTVAPEDVQDPEPLSLDATEPAGRHAARP
jgi:hypothetical protein